MATVEQPIIDDIELAIDSLYTGCVLVFYTAGYAQVLSSHVASGSVIATGVGYFDITFPAANVNVGVADATPALARVYKSGGVSMYHGAFTVGQAGADINFADGLLWNAGDPITPPTFRVDVNSLTMSVV